jgi:hypothetical protein
VCGRNVLDVAFAIVLDEQLGMCIIPFFYVVEIESAQANEAIWIGMLVLTLIHLKFLPCIASNCIGA